MTRLQKERQANGPIIKIGLEDLSNVKNTFKIMHPLPRQEEIDPSIDKHPSALYFQQARNGLWVRQALLGEILL
jgi:aspartate carbamoyltransferase catalytic subunit